MKLLALLLAVGPIATGPGTEYFAGMPPERFRGEAVVGLIVTSQEHLAAACGVTLPAPTAEQTFTLYGCSRVIAGRPYVIIPDPCPMGGYEQTATILCHELSHAAHGWPGNHPL